MKMTGEVEDRLDRIEDTLSCIPRLDERTENMEDDLGEIKETLRGNGNKGLVRRVEKNDTRLKILGVAILALFTVTVPIVLPQLV